MVCQLARSALVIIGSASYGIITGFHWFIKWLAASQALNTLRPRQNGLRFPDDIFKYIFLNEDVLISLKISLKFIPKVRINNIPALVQIMAWRWSGDKPLSEPMIVSLLTHICVTRPQWVETNADVNWTLASTPIATNETHISIKLEYLVLIMRWSLRLA